VAQGKTPPEEAVTEPGRGGAWAWVLLAALLLAGGLLLTATAQADPSTIFDDGWRGNARWAVGIAVVLLGLALIAVVWTVGQDRGPGRAPVAVLVAVLASVAATVVVGVADEEGGDVAPVQAPTVGVSGSESAVASDEADPPLSIDQATDEEQLTASALPITTRTLVTIELNLRGRQLFAAAMTCRPEDFRRNGLVGTAIGGTWTQPLLLVSAPFDDEGNDVPRCDRALIRLPVGAGIVRPG